MVLMFKEEPVAALCERRFDRSKNIVASGSAVIDRRYSTMQK
jgi:hypothetical protein